MYIKIGLCAKMISEISTKLFEEKLAQEKLNVLDVREADEYVKAHVPLSTNMPMSTFNIYKLDKDILYYVICVSGNRSGEVCRYLARRGYQGINVKEGLNEYKGKLASHIY